MSRARVTSQVYVAADEVDQAVQDLRAEWSIDRRQRRVLDVDEPATDVGKRRPGLALRIDATLRAAPSQRSATTHFGRSLLMQTTACARSIASYALRRSKLGRYRLVTWVEHEGQQQAHTRDRAPMSTAEADPAC